MSLQGVVRGQRGRMLPSWALYVIYSVVASLLGTCLAVNGLYGSFLSKGVVLMWLISAVSAFLTSALVLEPLKVGWHLHWLSLSCPVTGVIQYDRGFSIFSW